MLVCWPCSCSVVQSSQELVVVFGVQSDVGVMVGLVLFDVDLLGLVQVDLEQPGAVQARTRVRLLTISAGLLLMNSIRHPVKVENQAREILKTKMFFLRMTN